MDLVGYPSIAAFARSVQLPAGTVEQHLQQGYCKWPRVRKQSGMITHPLYRTWTGMKARCYEPSDTSYPNYGARGVTVSTPWLVNFWTFVEDMGLPQEGQTLDRIDNNLGYCRENCKWSSRVEQSHNSRRSGVTPGLTYRKHRDLWRVALKRNGHAIEKHFKQYQDAVSFWETYK